MVLDLAPEILALATVLDPLVLRLNRLCRTAPMLQADEVLEPEVDAIDVDAAGVEPDLAAPSPPPPCPMHRWGPCPTPPSSPPQDYEVQEEVEPPPPTLPAEPAQTDSPRLPSPTPAHEAVAAGASAASFGLGMHMPSPVGARAMNMDAGASSSSASLGLRLPTPAVARGDVFDNGAGSSSGPSAPRRWHIAPRAVLQRAGRRPGRWSPVNLGLANGHYNGVASGAHIPGGSCSSEEEHAAPGPSTRR